MQKSIVFNKPCMTGKEIDYIMTAYQAGHLSGDGQFTKRCHALLQEMTQCSAALLTHSCTAALEMAALLLNIQPGDEVIMPSFTFVSTANAFVLRGAVPVFVDIREDTLNLDETRIEAAITRRTKAIVPVHYAGVACEMDTIVALAQEHDIAVVEDAAQGIISTYKGRALGAIGHIGAYSFHETKNIISGEGGACLLNAQEYVLSAEIIREKGTDRSRFFRGEVDKYTWQDVGSSYLPSEILAAFLYAQLEQAKELTAMRLVAWERYHAALFELEQAGHIRRPIIPPHCTHNAHLYYILLASHYDRASVLLALKEASILAVFHYVPLHTAPAGKKYCRTHGELYHTHDISERLIRLPLWNEISPQDQMYVVETLHSIFS